MKVRYFERMQITPTLLRRVDMTDEAFIEGEWRPTRAVVDWMFGNDDFVSEISENEARTLAPAAF